MNNKLSEAGQISAITSLLDMADNEIKNMHQMWDKGDCSLAGIARIYSLQCIKQRRVDLYYNGDYIDIESRYKLSES